MVKDASSFIQIHEWKRWRKLLKPTQQWKPFHLVTPTKDEIVYLERIDWDRYRVVWTDTEMTIPWFRNMF